MQNCAHNSDHSSHGHSNGGRSHQEIILGEITLQNHEGVLVATLSFETSESHEAVACTLQEKLACLVQKVLSRDGVIGHIKSSIQDGSRITTLSTTGTDGVTSREGVSERASVEGMSEHASERASVEALSTGVVSKGVVSVNVVSIVLAIEQEALLTIMHSIFEEYVDAQ